MSADQPPHSESDNPFDGVDDYEVLERAKAALRRVHVARIGSIERSVQWAIYEQAKAELDVRAYRHILRKIHEKRTE